MRRHFPLSHLPLELALEILRLGASPTYHCTERGSDALVYSTACALARVSHNVRHAVMPHLLHTVIFRRQKSLHRFLRTLEQQNYLASIDSNLAIDYSRYVRRMWSSECFEPRIDDPKHHYRDYSLLYPIFTNACDIGLAKYSTHLMHEVFSTKFISSDRLPTWNCKRLTIGGDDLRWNGMVATAAGYAFLRQLTHLTLWVTPNNVIPQGASVSANNVPSWVHKVPLEHMPNLTHFAFTLDGYYESTKTVPTLVYVLPHAIRGSEEGGKLFRKWLSGQLLLNRNPFVRLLHLHDPNVFFDRCWEASFLRGENNIWEEENTPKHSQRTANGQASLNSIY